MNNVTEARGTAAKRYFTEGYNCAQAVCLAFADLLPIDKKTLVMLSSSFGGGMGRLREVCGAVSGMFIVIGALSGYTDISGKAEKAEHYARIQELANRFKAENGYIVCRELLGLDGKAQSPVPESRTPEYYKKRPCAEYCECAAEILENYLKENGYEI